MLPATARRAISIWFIGARAPLDKFGTLHILATGVDHYPYTGSRSPDLRFAGADACSFAETAANIKRALAGLARAGAGDTIMVFLAGHGQRDETGKTYYFMPGDLRRDPVFKWANRITWAQIRDPLIAAPGRRKLLFVDTCYAAGGYNELLDFTARQAGFAAFAATGPNHPAGEYPRLGHGAFTYFILDGLHGAARHRSELRALGLANHVTNEVRDYSHDEQVPQFTPGPEDYLLAR